jgi:hypothetical protein
MGSIRHPRIRKALMDAQEKLEAFDSTITNEARRDHNILEALRQARQMPGVAQGDPHQGQMIEQLVALVNDSYGALTRLAGSVTALQEAVKIIAEEMPSRRPKDDDLFGTRH